MKNKSKKVNENEEEKERNIKVEKLYKQINMQRVYNDWEAYEELLLAEREMERKNKKKKQPYKKGGKKRCM